MEMTPLAEKELRYLRKWESKRLKKWRYRFLHGILWFGLPVGILTYLWIIDFNFETFQFSRFCFQLITSSLTGVVLAYLSFRGQEQRYLEAKNKGLL